MVTPTKRWSAINELKGWTVCADFGEAVKLAHLKRNPKHPSYIPISQVVRLSKPDEERYGKLNETLHQSMRSLSKRHFAGIPVPAELQKEIGDESYFTPFTYQNYDWYGPSNECYIAVLTDYVSADLLRQIQALLVDDYRDWCIRVIGSDKTNFDADHEIAVFSDQVLVSVKDAKAFEVAISK